MQWALCLCFSPVRRLRSQCPQERLPGTGGIASQAGKELSRVGVQAVLRLDVLAGTCLGVSGFLAEPGAIL